MKQHIGSIYLILGLMSVSALTIGAGKAGMPKGEHLVTAQSMLPSPTSFHFAVSKHDKAQPARVLVLNSTQLGVDVALKMAKATSVARACKAG